MPHIGDLLFYISHFMKKYIISLLLLSPFFVSASFDKDISFGSRGPQVQALQQFLTSKGFYLGPINGSYFSLTLKAVKAFQSANSLPPTGYIGPMTRSKMNVPVVNNVSNVPTTTPQNVVTAKLDPVSDLIKNPPAPTKVLKVSANKTTIQADGLDGVSFRFQYLVSGQPTPAQVFLKSTIPDEPVYSFGVNTDQFFSYFTKVPGNHVLKFVTNTGAEDSIAINALTVESPIATTSATSTASPLVSWFGNIPPASYQSVKKLYGSSGPCNTNFNGTYCDILIYYTEDGVSKENVLITVSSDDNGVFTGGINTFSNPQMGMSKAGARYMYLGNNAAQFQYFPSSTGTRTLTARVGSISTTFTSQGQVEKCNGMTSFSPTYDPNHPCNQ